jgi:DNA-binding PadR family transcriptional regulator
MTTGDQILATLAEAGREVYGLEVRDAIQRVTGKAVPLGTLYVTLGRLEKKGHVAARDGESSHDRGGNRRRYFKITAAGLKAVRAEQDKAAATMRAWKGVLA